MSEEPSEPTELNAPATPLHYATHVGAYPEAQSHSRSALVLIGLTALAGFWSIFLGVFCLSDLWVFGVMLIGAGVCHCWATLGKLSASNMRLRAAVAILLIAGVLEVAILVLSHHLLMEVTTQFGEDTTGRSIPMYEVIRNTSVVPAILVLSRGFTPSFALPQNEGLISISPLTQVRTQRYTWMCPTRH